MAEEIGSLAVKIALDNTGFQEGVNKINNSLKALDAEFKANTAALGANGKGLEGLQLKGNNLTKSMDLQKQKVAVLETAYQKSVTAKGSDAKATQDLEIKLNKAKTALSNMETELDKTNKNIAIQSSSWTKMGNTLNDAGARMKTVGEGMLGVGKKMTIGLTLPIVGIGIAAAKLGMDFDSAMSRVKAMSGATGEGFKKLNDQAIQLGQDTAFSAMQAAEGMGNLASAGFGVEEIMKAMPGLLDLAASGGLDVATASDIASSALRGFGLDAGQSGHVADVLAKTAAGTNAEVTDLGMALKYAAPPAHALGMSIEEVSAAIGIMSNAGIKGEQAGTTLRASLIALASPSSQAADTMKAIGFNAFDATGKMLPFRDVIDRLKESTKNLTQEKKADALATIFGREAISGMMVVMDAGPAKFDELTKSFKSSDGAAKEMAKTMQDNAKSSIEQMMGSLETAAIKIEQAVAPTLRDLAKTIEDLANKFSSLSPAMQKTIIVTGLLVAVAGPLLAVGGTLMTVAGGIAEFCGAASIALGITTATAAVATPAVAGLGVATAGTTTVMAGLGTALGAALLPLLPFIAGIAAVIAIGVAVAAVMSKEATPAVNLFADRVVTSGTQMAGSMNETSVKITEGTKKAVGAYMELDAKASQSLADLYVNSTVISQNTANSLISIYTQMNLQIKTGMDKHYTDQYTTMQAFFNKSSALSTVEEAAILTKMTQDNANKKTQEDVYNAQIRDIITKASNEKRALTLDEQQKINTIQNTMKTNAVTSLSDSEIQSKVILQRLKDYGANITAEQAGEIIKNANHQRDGSVTAAQQEYEKVVANIILQRDGTHEITADQATKLIADAKRQKDESIIHAEGLRKGVVDKVTGMNKDVSKSVDTTTGEMLNNWDKLKRWWESWNPKAINFKAGVTITQTKGTGMGDLPSKAVGDRYLPTDMIIQAHQGEMIVPKSENPYANSGGKILPSSVTTINFNGTYAFPDNQSIDYFMNQAAVLIQRRAG